MQSALCRVQRLCLDTAAGKAINKLIIGLGIKKAERKNVKPLLTTYV
jgi:hypothetical protein